MNPSKVLPQTSHGMEHHLETRGPPIASPFRRLDTENLAAAKAEFAALERDITVPDTYPLPNMMDFSSRVAGCSIFTKIDLRKGYYQIPLHPANILKTSIIMPFGLFEFLRLTFGLRNAGSTFQRLMDWVLSGLAFAFVYLDDIIIASPSVEQYQQDVEEVFRRLQAAGLVINFEKCTFAVPEVDFLVHRVSASGFAPLPSRVAAIKKYPQPATVKQLLAFLGVFNFYRRFVPAAAKIPTLDIFSFELRGLWSELVPSVRIVHSFQRPDGTVVLADDRRDAGISDFCARMIFVPRVSGGVEQCAVSSAAGLAWDQGLRGDVWSRTEDYIINKISYIKKFKNQPWPLLRPRSVKFRQHL